MSLNHKHNPDLHFIFPLKFYRNHFYFITVTHKLKNLSCGFILNNVKKCKCWIFFPKKCPDLIRVAPNPKWVAGISANFTGFWPGLPEKTKTQNFFFQSERHKLRKKNQLREREREREREKACLVCVCVRAWQREREKNREREREWMSGRFQWFGLQ